MAKGKKKIGISLKTSLACGIIVLILLTVSAVVSIRMQYTMSESIISSFESSQKRSLEKGFMELDQALISSIEANMEICRSVTQNFLYNFDQNGMFTLLRNYMKIDGIVAIQVRDIDGGPFGASWKESDIEIGREIPEEIEVDESLSVIADAVHENEKVGDVRIYYTRDLIKQEIQKRQEQTDNAISNFHKLFGKNIDTMVMAQVVLSACIIVALILTIFFSLLFIVTRPIQQTVEMVKDIAEGEGDLTKRLQVKYNDEIGELATWFNIFVDKLQILITSISSNSSIVNSSAGELSGISGAISKGIISLSDRSQTVAAAAEEMSANMTSVAAACEQASTNINMVAAATEEMTNTITEIAGSSEQARVITSEAVKKSADAVSRVNLLGDAAKDISKVTEVINEISGQTNLLALNATIEAARAGEAGKGFAVVANEIKALAKQTADATLEIKEKINNIQTSTEASVSEIDQISAVIGRVNDIVISIATAMDEQSSTTNEIAQNISQASQGIQDVNENVAQSSSVSEEIARDISEVNQVTSELSNSCSQLDLSATDMSELASKLKTLVGKFKTGTLECS
ncbi:MAG: HAMP domain-containing protein [Desulfamplus sp.]|nr:HAMP domain-containing protein [Desulfamplus sp.]